MKKKILIADDNPNMRLLLNEYLQYDFEVITVEDGAQLLEQLKNGNLPNLIISDLNMPMVNGWEVLDFIKNSLFYRNIPVIVLSSSEKSNERIKSFEAGADDYVIKPFSPQELKLRIQNLFKRNNYEYANK